MVSLAQTPKAVGAVRYVDRSILERECADYRRIRDAQPARFVESFMTAPSPGIIALAMPNEFYPSTDVYLAAVADALRTEYEYIVAQGHILQIDGPDLAMERHTTYADRPAAEFLAFVDQTIAAINRTLTNIPRDRVRLHVCWGNYEAPHQFDMPLEDLLPHLYGAHVGALMLSMANPRHEHEYRCFARHPLPKDMLLVVGAIDTTTNYVEHPEVVADRITAAVEVMGDRTRVVAGVDCGFGTFAGSQLVEESVVWTKLRTLREGADLASKRLWG
jgi:5-methyltetrahydropteroyltriglutamate--homocysteine methyltransferase